MIINDHVIDFAHLHRNGGDRLLIKTLVKFMAVKYNPSSISCNKVIKITVTQTRHKEINFFTFDTNITQHVNYLIPIKIRTPLIFTPLIFTPLIFTHPQDFAPL